MPSYTYFLVENISKKKLTLNGSLWPFFYVLPLCYFQNMIQFVQLHETFILPSSQQKIKIFIYNMHFSSKLVTMLISILMASIFHLLYARHSPKCFLYNNSWLPRPPLWVLSSPFYLLEQWWGPHSSQVAEPRIQPEQSTTRLCLLSSVLFFDSNF